MTQSFEAETPVPIANTLSALSPLARVGLSILGAAGSAEGAASMQVRTDVAYDKEGISLIRGDVLDVLPQLDPSVN